MPIRHEGMLASRASTWLRDHFWRNTIAPRLSRPTMWNEYLPISIPITAIADLHFSAWRAPVLGAPCQRRTLERQEHGRTIPLADSMGWCGPGARRRNVKLSYKFRAFFR